MLADGSIFLGEGLGATGAAEGEVCFNTAMTGYQEILTDPSYAAQIVAFTFPHIGNVGTNNEDVETSSPAAAAAARGAVFRTRPTLPSNWRSDDDLDSWLKKRNVIALAGLDTRALTKRIREHGMPNAVIAHAPDGKFDLEKLHARAKAWSGLDGLDLAKDVTTAQSYVVNEKRWQWPIGVPEVQKPKFTVVVMDYGGALDYLTIDITRTWPVSGRFTDTQLRAYRTALEAEKAIIAAIRPRVTRDAVRKIAEDIFRKQGFDPRYAYIGHYVGLSVHDGGDWSLPFEAGMVMAIEPIIDIPEQQLHIRVEDTILVTPTGAEILSAGVPKEVDELLALIKR